MNEKEEVLAKLEKTSVPKTKLHSRSLSEIEDVLPEKRIDFRSLLYWMDLGASQAEIAGAFHVSVSTLSRIIAEKTGFTWKELKETCCGEMKIRLRENQFKMSETNPTMAIWLGKNWLGQKDNSKEHEVTINPAIRASMAKENANAND